MKNLLASLFALVIALPAAFATADSAESVSPLLIGSVPANFQIESQSGDAMSFAEIQNGKPTVVVFYRGGWCPYCNKHLRELGKIESELIDLGYQIIGISPDSPEKLNALDSKIEVAYQLYSDRNFAAADAFGISFQLEDKMLKRLKGYGIDLNKASGGTNSDKLPVSSVFLLTPKGEVSFSYVDPNYKFRIPSDLLLAAAKSSLRFHKK